MSVVADIARALQEAYATGLPIAPVRDRIRDPAMAYAVQQAQVAAWQARGHKIVGRKIGLTAKAVQQQLGVDEPDFGTILDHMVVADAARVARGAVLQPRVEAEVAFMLAKDLPTAEVTPEIVVAATAYVCPAIEICGSRIAAWNIKLTDTIADNASSGLIVLGEARHKPVLADLAAVTVAVMQNGAVSAEGKGAACLGNPALAVAWLAQALGRFGARLKAGDVIMSGALAPMLSAAPGDSFAADFGAFGKVSISFAA